MNRKAIAIALAALMLLALMGACASPSQAPVAAPAASTAPAASASTGGDTAPQQQEPEGPALPELPNNTLSLTVNIPNFGTNPTGTYIQGRWQEEMEKYLGCKLDISWNLTPWQDYRETEKVLIQAGDIPDVATYSQSTFVNSFGADGVVLDVMKYKDYMNYYLAYVEETNGGYSYVTNADGSSYYFFDGYQNPDNLTGAQSFTSYAYRFDVLEANGLTPATTIDEFTALCAKLQELIDNGTVNAKYVMSNSDKNYALYRGFVGTFHTWDTTYWNGSKWSYGPIEDNFREMLKYINSLYAAGYIDPEFATDDSELATTKAVSNNHLVVPTLWSGMATHWNDTSLDKSIKWGLAYLPENPKYGTAWKWGSKQDGRSLSNTMGIIINGSTKYPEWVVKMIDYQYSDFMVDLLNWGNEGEHHIVNPDGSKVFTDPIMTSENPVQAAADFGLMSSAACRTGIPFVPQNFYATMVMIKPETWWNPTDGYYEGKYWIESGRLGGEASVSPYDRPPVLRLTDDEATENNATRTACNTYAQEQGFKFITGELDINDDAVWNNYVNGVKSQASDFDGLFATLQEKSVLN